MLNVATSYERHGDMYYVDPRLAFYLAKLLEPLVGDVLITRDEVTGLMANLLISQREPTGHTNLKQWLAEHTNSIGRAYASELRRHYRH